VATPNLPVKGWLHRAPWPCRRPHHRRSPAIEAQFGRPAAPISLCMGEGCGRRVRLHRFPAQGEAGVLSGRQQVQAATNRFQVRLVGLIERVIPADMQAPAAPAWQERAQVSQSYRRNAQSVCHRQGSSRLPGVPPSSGRS